MIGAASAQSFRFRLFRHHPRFHQCFVNKRDGIRPDTDFSPKWIVESGYQKNKQGEDGCQHAAKDEMHMDLRVLQPDQDDVQQCAPGHYPPQGCRQPQRYISQLRSAQFDEAIEFAHGFGVDDLFAALARLEDEQNLGKRRYPLLQRR